MWVGEYSRLNREAVWRYNRVCEGLMGKGDLGWRKYNRRDETSATVPLRELVLETE